MFAMLASVAADQSTIEPVYNYNGLFQFAVTLILAAVAALFTAKLCTARWEGRRVKTSIVACILTVLATTASMLFHGLGMHNIKTLFLSCVMLYLSYGDIKTHDNDDWLHFLVLAISLIEKPAGDIPTALLCSAVVFGLMLGVHVLVQGAGIGGADIKFCTAAAFLTSDLLSCLVALGLGTFVALLCNSPFRKKEGAEKPYAMLPYLSCSYMIVFLLSRTA